MMKNEKEHYNANFVSNPKDMLNKQPWIFTVAYLV